MRRFFLLLMMGLSAGLNGCADPVPPPAVEQRGAAAPVIGPGYDTPFLLPGINRPPTLTAQEARLDDEAAVIGVSVDGKHRAYLLRAFENMSTHVVNDMLAETPISVTHCNLVHCTRVFSTQQRGELIELSLGGWEKEKMTLRLNGLHYPQTSQKIPLADFPFEETTWKEWKTAHPESDVYVGETADAEAEAAK